MAEPTAQPSEEPAAETPPPKRGSSLFAVLATVIVLTLVGGGGGGLLGFRLHATIERAVKAEEAAKDQQAAPPYTGPTHVRDLAPIVTNLREPRDTWVRLEAAVVFEDEALAGNDALIAEIGGDLLAYLRTVSLAQVEGASGLLHLREDLTERAAVRSQGGVRELVVKTLIFQ
jgi:flagellar FliL protein